MGYDALLAAAAAREVAERLRGRNLLAVRAVFGCDLLLVFGPRREPAAAVLAGEPLPAFYFLAGARLGAYEEATGALPPAPGLEAFARLLEARLAGRPLAGARAYPWERTVELAFGGREGLRGVRDQAILVHEAAPKPAHVVLTGSDRRVVATWPVAEPSAGSERETRRLAHGMRYLPPAPGGDFSPDDLAADGGVFAAALRRARDEAMGADDWADPAGAGRGGTPRGKDAPPPAWRLLLRIVPPLGPLVAREIARRAGAGEGSGTHQAGVAPETLFLAYREIATAYAAGLAEPCLLLGPAGEPDDVAACHVAPRPGGRVLESLSPGEALAAWHVWNRLAQVREGLAARLRRTVRAALARAERKTGRQAADLARAGEADDLRRKGELLLANLRLVPPGREEVTLTDYEGRLVTIALDPRLSPSQNAQRYFARYRKSRRAAQAEAPRDRALHELAWLRSVAYDFERVAPGGSEPAPAADHLERVWRGAAGIAASLTELAAIETSLLEAGYGPRAGRAGGRSARRAPSPVTAEPRRFVTGDGLTVLAGRSARQNEMLSLKTAQPGDLWFHARACPGSHVVLRVPPGMAAAEVPAASILQAAALAAHLSAARGGGKVPVDYTEARHLRRPKGAPPGLVLYDPHQTVLVDTARVSLPGEAGDPDRTQRREG